ncbi:YciI family protein [Isoptericola croceus]|uniref:YciI family protein n=1 Tax=Isoptericola croceus TaxID=3031406 RepID=UPI0023F7A8D0|nr:YciI family protein [Isoptericola croceus]
MTVYAVTYDYAADSTAARDRVRPAHRDHLQALRAEGSVLVSGPLPATDTDPDGALIVVAASSASAATALLDDDPFRREGLVARVSVREWVPVIGGFAA